MKIEIGYWAIPLVITLVAFLWANAGNRPTDSFGLGGAIDMVLAVIVSLVAWLIWAVLT